MKWIFSLRSGQSLVELLVAIGVGAILFVGTAALVAPSLEINKVSSQQQVGAALGQELLDNVRVWSEGNWHNVLSLATSSAHAYYLNTSSSPFTATSGIQSILVSTTTFTRSFYLSDVYRDINGNVTTTVSGNFYDPSTKQVTVNYNWTRGATTTMVAYITRNHNAVLDQTDWSDGAGLNGPVTSPNAQFASSTGISYNISGSLFASAPSSAGYAYTRSITVTSTTSIASGTLVNFPMLVSSTVSSWEPVSDGGHIQHLCTAPNGGQEPCDLVFATSTANCGIADLNFETESYTSSTGALVDWVNVPTMQAGSVIYACYDDSAVSTDQSHPNLTWNSNYTGVWHFPAPNGTLEANDSTANGDNGTLGSASTAVNGEIGNSGVNVNTPTYGPVYTPNSPTFTAATFSAWVDMLASNTWAGVIYSRGGSEPIGMNLDGYSSDHLGYTWDNNDSNTYSWDSGLSLPIGSWAYAVVTVSSTGATAYVCQSGTCSSSSENYAETSQNSGTGWYIGGDNSDLSSRYFGGSIDEARISTVALSSSWIVTEYNNQNSPGIFYALGSETVNSASGGGGSISSSAGDHWAWNDEIGWIDFYNNNNVSVSSTGLHGYASSSVGAISLDCATSPSGNICTGSGSGPDGYSYYRSITTTSNTSLASGTETSFPMLVSSTVSSWEPVSDGGHIQHLCTAPNGGQEPCDLVFATSTANCGIADLNFETESYTSSTGALVDWVNVPTMQAGSVIYACYDSSSVSTDQSNPSGVWNSNYVGVYHFPTPTSTLSAKDSTANNNNGTVSSALATNGEIDGGARFSSASSSVVNLPAFNIFNAHAFTVSGWINQTVSQEDNVLLYACYAQSNDQCLHLVVRNSQPYMGFYDDDMGYGSISTGVWDYVTYVYDGSHSRYIYLNGSLYASGSSTGVLAVTNGTVANTGGLAFGTYTNASLDELEIANTMFSPSWILTEYNNQSSPSSFYSVGSETSFGVGSLYQVLNDGEGDLSGWAWNDEIGWISFCGGQNTANCPGTTNYQTTIDSGGNFQGWAWNDDVGWISFNCDNTSGCGTSNYEVLTTWLPPTTASSTGQLTSAVFDTGDASGAQFNSIMWQGSQVSGSTVQFQFAVSNSSSGPWNYDGTDGTSNTYYTPIGPGDAVSLSDTAFDNYRYFRYRIFITYANGSSSRVSNVVVNWSP